MGHAGHGSSSRTIQREDSRDSKMPYLSIAPLGTSEWFQGAGWVAAAAAPDSAGAGRVDHTTRHIRVVSPNRALTATINVCKSCNEFPRPLSLTSHKHPQATPPLPIAPYTKRMRLFLGFSKASKRFESVSHGTGSDDHVPSANAMDLGSVAGPHGREGGKLANRVGRVWHLSGSPDAAGSAAGGALAPAGPCRAVCGTPV